MDDESPLMQPIKTAFYEAAAGHAARLQGEVDEGRMSSAEAAQHLTQIMSQPETMQAVIRASQINQVTH